MAQFKAEGVEDLMKDLSSLKVDMILPKMLEGAVDILEKNVKKRASGYVVTGAMAGSIKPTKAKRVKDGYSISVRPTGTDGKGVRNMEKMAYHEYGTSKQKAVPILTPAVNESRAQVEIKMQEIFEREVKV